MRGRRRRRRRRKCRGAGAENAAVAGGGATCGGEEEDKLSGAYAAAATGGAAPPHRVRYKPFRVAEDAERWRRPVPVRVGICGDVRRMVFRTILIARGVQRRFAAARRERRLALPTTVTVAVSRATSRRGEARRLGQHTHRRSDRTLVAALGRASGQAPRPYLGQPPQRAATPLSHQHHSLRRTTQAAIAEVAVLSSLGAVTSTRALLWGAEVMLVRW